MNPVTNLTQHWDEKQIPSAGKLAFCSLNQTVK